MQATLEILNRFYEWSIPENVEVEQVRVETKPLSKRLATVLVARIPSPSRKKMCTHIENVDGIIPRNRHTITWEGQEVTLVIPKEYWKFIGMFRRLIKKLYKHKFEILLKADKKSLDFWAYMRYPGTVFRTAFMRMMYLERKPVITYEAVLSGRDILGTDTPKGLLENAELWEALEENMPTREDAMRFAQTNLNAVLTMLENAFRNINADYIYRGKNNVFAEFGRISVSTKLNSSGGIPTWVQVEVNGELKGEFYLDAGGQIHWNETLEAIKELIKLKKR